MALTFQQTDEVSACAPMAACAPAPSSPIEAPLVDVSMRVDGTPGTTEETMDIPAGSSVYKTFFQSGQVGRADWPGGDWTVNINITTAQNNITLSGVWICRIKDDCTPDVAVGSNTTGFDASAAGVISVPVSGTLTSGLETDRVYIVCEFTNSHSMTARTVGVTPSETVASPIPETTVIAPSVEGLSLSEPSPLLITPIVPAAEAATLGEPPVSVSESTPIAGTVTLGGSPVQGATVHIVDSSTDTVIAQLTTDANGEFSYQAAGSGPFHAAVQHDDGAGTQYNAPSFHSL